MGCDVFYDGILPDEGLQVEVLRFVTPFYGEIPVRRIDPIPGEHFLTSSDALKPPISYPFDFLGVVPCWSGELDTQRQFIFDRAAGGRLIRFEKLPKKFNLPPRDTFGDDCEVIVREGGYTRELVAEAFTLLLNIIRLRWCPDLKVGDDWNCFDDVGNRLWEFGLVKVVQNPNLSFRECWDLYEEECNKRHPTKVDVTEEQVPMVRLVPPDADRIRIEDLDLSVRCKNTLRQLKIGTVGELIAYGEAELLAMSNMSRKSLFEIRDILGNLGLHLSSSGILPQWDE